MGWHLLKYEHPTKEELRQLFGEARFYVDHNLDESFVLLLRHLKYGVETARETGAQDQPDEFHYRRAFKSKRVLLTQDKDYLDNERFPLSQTRGVIIFNIDPASPREIARALEVVDVVLARISPVLDEAKVLLNADYTLTFIKRKPFNGGFKEDRTRYRLDENGRDVWIWEDD